MQVQPRLLGCKSSPADHELPGHERVIVRNDGPEQLFDTGDPTLAANYLTALGCHAACEQGFAVDQPEVALRAALTAVSAGVRPAIELLPLLATSLRTSGSAERDAMRTAIDEAVRLVGVVLPAWQPMLSEFGLATPRVLN